MTFATLRAFRFAILMFFMWTCALPIRAERAPLPPGAAPENSLKQGVYARLHGVSMRDNITQQLKAFKEICELSFKKPLRINGDQEKAGRIDTYLYMDERRTAVYTIETMPNPVQPDPCLVNLEERIRIKLMRYDGRQTTIWIFDAKSHSGTKRVVMGRSPLLQYGASQSTLDESIEEVAEGGSAKEVVAGRKCHRSQRANHAYTTDVCQLKDKDEPAFIQGLPLKISMTFTNGNTMYASEVSEMNANASIDTGVFNLPNDFREGRGR